MKIVHKICVIMLLISMTLTGSLYGINVVESSKSNSATGADENGTAPLILQRLNYKENPIDVPNPDRGFYRRSTFIVPVEALENEPEIPELGATIVGTTVFVNARIVYTQFNLKNFSSNAPLNGMPLGEWSAENAVAPEYGKTQPLTPAALNYIRSVLQKIRESEAVAIVVFTYDGQGFTYNNRGGYDLFLHDCEPGAPKGRKWYETGEVEESDLCGIPGHEDKNWVQYHLWQLGHIFSEYEDCIMVAKGGFFGPWGEMHSTTYAKTKEGYHWLLEAMLGYVPASRSILVHAGGVMAWHNVEYGTDYSFQNLMPAPERGTKAQRFGARHDSYSAGFTGEAYNDNGSLSEGYRLIGSGSLKDFDRNAALTWIRNQNNFFGGETVGPGPEENIYPRFPNVLYEAAYAQTTHLNTSYSARTYKLWGDVVYTKENIAKPYTPPHDGVTRTAIFDPVYDGRNGMEYIRDRLGYRLVLREAKANEWVKLNGTLKFEGKLQNVGFGNIVNKKNVTVILQSKDGCNRYSALTSLDARDWRPDLDSRADNTAAWRDLNFTVDLSKFSDLVPGDYDIYLKINDPKETTENKRCIQFANYDIWNSTLGANLIGSTSVIP